MSAQFLRSGVVSAALAALAALAVAGEALAQRAGRDGVAPGAPPAEAAAEAVGQCAPGRARFKTLDDLVDTNSTSFSNIPGSGVVFTSAGPGSSCVVVRFSAMAFAPGTRLMHLQAVLDGSTAGTPGDIQFASGDGSFQQARSFEWVFPNVPPGKHTLVIRYRSHTAIPVYLSRRTTMVHFR
jgi:hypothetical protein